MFRIKPTWCSWMRFVSLSSIGGVTGALLFWGSGAVPAQQGTIIIHRGAPPAPQTFDPSGQQVNAPPTAPASFLTSPMPATLPPVPPPLPSQFVAAPAPALAQPPNPSSGLLNLVPPASDPLPPTASPVPILPPTPSGWTNAPVVAKPNNNWHTPVSSASTNGNAPKRELLFPPLPPLSPSAFSGPSLPVRMDTAPPPTAGVPLPKLDMQKELNQFARALVASPAAGVPVPTPEVQREYNQFVKAVVAPQTTLDLVAGRTRLMVLADTPQRVQVGDDKTLAFEQLSPTELSLKAKTVGTTELNLWFPDPSNPSKHKILSYLVRVFPDSQTKELLHSDFQALANEINRVFPESQVSLAAVGDKIAVSGNARDAAQAAQILGIVRAHAPMQLGSAAVDSPALHTTFKVALTEGEQPSSPASTAEQLVQAAGPNVINLLRVPGEQQVMLRVTVAEVNRAAARSIGLNCSVERHDGVTIFATRTGDLAGLTNMGGANVPVFLDDGQIGLAIHALRGLNLARSIAEPHLAALNGHRAEFTTGGKFPVPSDKGVAFIPYGVHLSFTPLVQEQGTIRLSVQAAVSTKDVASTVNIGCTPVPGLNERTFETTVELREGQTMAVAGLIQNNCGSASQGSPALCDLPGVGRLFGSEITSSSEQELIVLITPELVHPMECKDVPPIPGASLIQPSDVEFYLLGHLQGQGMEAPSPARVDPVQMKRVNHREDLFIAGPQGYSKGHE